MLKKKRLRKRIKKKEDKDKKDVSAETGVKIDLEGITDRIIKLPLPGSYYGNFIRMAKKSGIMVAAEQKVYDLKNKKEDTVADGASMSVTWK